MKTRILSALIMLPLLAVLYFGGWSLWMTGLLIGLLGVKELYQGFTALDIHPTAAIGYGFAFALYGVGLLEPDPVYYTGLLVAVAVAGALTLFPMEGRQISDGLATIFGAIYVVFFSYHVVLIDGLAERELIWLVVITAFATDIFAYFSGYLFGKHKLSPKISPKKTIEGAIGGVIGSTLLCLLFGYLVIPSLLLHSAVIGLIGSAFAQLGDLTASVFKRKMGIKDYGTLIPGHGGILDRFDSVLFTAPFVYYYSMLVIY